MKITSKYTYVAEKRGAYGQSGALGAPWLAYEARLSSQNPETHIPPHVYTPFLGLITTVVPPVSNVVPTMYGGPYIVNRTYGIH